MDPDDLLSHARSGIAAVSARTAELLRSLPDVTTRIPRSTWSVREAAVHLVNFAAVNSDVAVGMPSPRTSLAKEAVALDNDRRIADVPETDPDKLARLLTEAVDRFLDTIAHLRGGQPVTWHCGLRIDLAALAGIQLGELILHGYDMATAVAFPWPIDSLHSQLVLYGYGPAYAEVVHPERTRGLTAGYRITLEGAPPFTVRFVDGDYRLDPADTDPVDCTISADPVAFLLVGAGRLTIHQAVALGVLTVGGDRPGLALAFPDLFVYP